MAQDLSSSERQHKVDRKITLDCAQAVAAADSNRYVLPKLGVSFHGRSSATHPVRQSATASYDSPARHHTRNHTAPRRVKETLNARSEYTTSQDDGAAEHRINQYLIKQEIGRGSFGAVHLAVDQYGQEYAVKEFSKSRLRKRAQSHVLRNPHGSRRPGIIPAGVGLNSPLHRHPSGHEDEEGGNPLYLIKEEIAIMKKLHHHNLVALIEVLDDPTEDSLYMVMEMCKKGVIMKVGLGEPSDPYDNESCRCWFRDLILGIEYLHAQNIVHRDIKPDNCLLTNDDVLKVVDFGVSEMFEKHSDMYTAKSAGSPAFLPPELCVAKHGDISGTAADIWSMGVTLYCLRYGRIPFEKESIFELYESIRSDEVKYEGEIDEDFKDLMSRILEKDPAKRINMTVLRAHPWVTKGGADPLLSAEENTADLVGRPTEEEMDTAITKKMGNVLAVVKAVQKFKKLIEPEDGVPMESILGEDVESHFVQPPLTMWASEEADFPSVSATHSKSASINLKRKSCSTNEKLDSSRRAGNDAGPSPGASQYSIASRKSVSPPPQTSCNTPSKLSFSEGTRGHARDPLEEEHLYLHIGPSTITSIPVDDENASSDYFGNAEAASIAGSPETMDMVPIVSESPGASDIDIYETAYREEVERIRKQSFARRAPAPKVYLTRRVEGKRSTLRDLLQQGALEGLEQTQPPSPFANAVANLSSISATSKSEEATPKDDPAPGLPHPSPTQPPTTEGGVDGGTTAGQPASSRPSLSTRTSGTATAVTATTNTTATVTASITEKSRTGLRSLLGRVRRESTQMGKK
ncbi:hypothetical protein FQN52_004088 [Onygenales sp. PD_12]|nr:hypothetical protein FQN52_004088 [Onygenales sp. PD_12]